MYIFIFFINYRNWFEHVLYIDEEEGNSLIEENNNANNEEQEDNEAEK